MQLRMWPAVLLLPLTSCIPVEDFGAYWDRMGIDPQIKGKWKRIADQPGETRERGFPIGDVAELVEKDGAYELIRHPLQPAPDDDGPMWPVRTFTTGRHRWIAVRRTNGFVIGYQLDRGYLHICSIGGANMADFIRKRYPGAPNVEAVSGIGFNVSIKLFDTTAFALLRAYPGVDHCAQESFAKYERVQ